MSILRTSKNLTNVRNGGTPVIIRDPNLKYILSRIRVLLDKNRRTHYLFLKKIQKKDYIRKSKEYYYDLNKQQLRMHDLLRYGIETVLIDDYNQIPEILKEVKKNKMQKMDGVIL